MTFIADNKHIRTEHVATAIERVVSR